MSHEEIVALKLQMGVSPSAVIAPAILLAMWQQLNIESAQTRGKRSIFDSNPLPTTFSPIDE
jgi:hypothetical protein